MLNFSSHKSYSTYLLPNTTISSTSQQIQQQWETYHAGTPFAGSTTKDPNRLLVADVLQSREKLESKKIQEQHQITLWNKATTEKGLINRANYLMQYVFLKTGQSITFSPTADQLFNQNVQDRLKLAHQIALGSEFTSSHIPHENPEEVSHYNNGDGSPSGNYHKKNFSLHSSSSSDSHRSHHQNSPRPPSKENTVRFANATNISHNFSIRSNPEDAAPMTLFMQIAEGHKASDTDNKALALANRSITFYKLSGFLLTATATAGGIYLISSKTR